MKYSAMSPTALQALRRIHDMGVLHGDIRRENILISKTEEDWQVMPQCGLHAVVLAISKIYVILSSMLLVSNVCVQKDLALHLWSLQHLMALHLRLAPANVGTLT